MESFILVIFEILVIAQKLRIMASSEIKEGDLQMTEKLNKNYVRDGEIKYQVTEIKKGQLPVVSSKLTSESPSGVSAHYQIQPATYFCMMHELRVMFIFFNG